MTSELIKKSFFVTLVLLSVLILTNEVSARVIYGTDFVLENKIENTTVKYSFTAGVGATPDLISANTIKVHYIAHSQSYTNYKKNGVKITLIKDGEVVREVVDEYNSQSRVGTPIPGYERIQTIEDVSFQSGDTIEMEINVWSGDFTNYVSMLGVKTGWQIAECAKSHSIDLTVDEIIQNETKTFQFKVGELIDTTSQHCHDLKISYIAHSQSVSNKSKNGVKIIISKSGKTIGWTYDQYDSHSSEGSPIPGQARTKLTDLYSLSPGDTIDIEVTVWRGDYKNYLSSLRIETSWEIDFAEKRISIDDVKGMRKNYNVWAGDVPLGDINRANIGQKNPYQRLVFSESISYALFANVIQLNGDEEDLAKSKFLTYWEWAKDHCLRRNIENVCSYNYIPGASEINENYKQCIPMPEEIKDDLLAWRWVPESDCPEECQGIIYQYTDPELNPEGINVFQDGTQVASDGDLLTAYALYLAYQRGWGDFLLEDAKKMVVDLRKKAVIDFKAGEMLNAEKIPNPNNVYMGTYVDADIEGTINEFEEAGALSWCGKYNYFGLWHNPFLDLSNLESIDIRIKGSLGENSSVDFRVQDKIEGNDTGHVYRTIYPMDLTDNEFNLISLTKDDFVKNPDFGDQQGELDWSKIKDLQFQVGKRYSEYSGAFDSGVYSEHEHSESISWSGNRCFWGGIFLHLHDFSDFKEIRIKLKGSGAVDFMLGDGFPGDFDKKSVFYHTGDIELTDQFVIHQFSYQDFSYFPYNTELRSFDWSKIRSFQFQVSSVADANVDISYVEIELNNGSKFYIRKSLPKILVFPLNQ